MIGWGNTDMTVATHAWPVVNSAPETHPAPGATVPKRLTHRHHADQVLMTGIRRTGDHRFTLTARWPEDHCFQGPVLGGWTDPQLLAESIRQASILLAHVGYETPFDHQITMHELSFDVDGDALRPAAPDAGERNRELVLEVVCGGVSRPGATLKRMHVTIGLHLGGRPVGTARTLFSCLPPAVYRRVRGDVRYSDDPTLPPVASGVSPRLVGRVDEQDVMLARGLAPDAWPLRVDRDHQVVFDHRLDHVPGMALIEAMRQAAHVSTGRCPAQLVSVHCEFAQYVEFADTCLIVAHPPEATEGAAVALVVEAHQSGTVAARARLVLLGEHRD
ncbi:ScbA/BarX family gamma-butyrolactone biosynthesis protein [Streptomyces sparsus]